MLERRPILHIPPPQSPKQVWEFLGTARFCQLWIPGFAELAGPLYPLTKNGQPFHWEEEEHQGFDRQSRLCSRPLL